jgi:hypothetical protein
VNGQILPAFILSVALAGCQAVLPDGRVPTSEDRFQDAWSLYARCLKSSDVIETETAAGRLRRAVQVIDDATTKVFGLIARFVDHPPSRLAADPKAMWAACTLHAAHTAVTQGHEPTAIGLLHSVLAASSEAESSYYVAQARAQLALLGAFAASPSSLRLVSSR